MRKALIAAAAVLLVGAGAIGPASAHHGSRQVGHSSRGRQSSASAAPSRFEYA